MVLRWLACTMMEAAGRGPGLAVTHLKLADSGNQSNPTWHDDGSGE
jgi:hypothetical protein